MDNEIWHQLWQRNEIGFHQREVNVHLRDYWGRLGLAPGSRAFVPLCGKSRDMLWLRAQGHQVLGVEISPIAVKAFFEENGLEAGISPQGRFERWELDRLVLLLGDFFDLTAEELAGSVGVYDRASLVALPPDLRREYSRQLQRILPERSEILLVTLQFPAQDMAGPPFAVAAAEVEALYGDRYRIECLCVRDVLAENPGLKGRGLTQLQEQVFHLTALDRSQGLAAK